jgi:hypothetical protein
VKRRLLSFVLVFLMLLGALLMTLKLSSFLTNSVSSISGIVGNLNHELLEYANPEKPTHDDSSFYFQRFFISKFTLDDRAV